MSAIALVAVGCVDLPTTHKADIPEGIPPGAGSPPPYIDIHAPGRTADRLAAWATPIAAATGIPRISLEAYANVAEIQRQQHPECGIAWTTLAGIAGVESRHGEYRGATIAANGNVRPRIRGVVLDGSNGNRRIENSGRDAHNSSDYERAMGPFQFLPETWQRYGVDANGDGVADPDNIDDASLSAARYLCVSGGDMTAAPGWEKAVLTYNNSMSYVINVRDHSNAYSVGVAY